MAIQHKLQTRLAQKIILTPSLQQAIKLLPMSTLELRDLLNQEVVDNPLLEEIPEDDPSPQSAAEPAGKADAAAPEAAPAADGWDSWDDADYEYFFGDYLDDSYRPRAPADVRELPPIEHTLPASDSLSDHLARQLRIRTGDDRLRAIGLAIIGNLDEDGYLVASVDEIAAMEQWSGDAVTEALDIVQRLDPVGVAARDLRECLLLQLRAAAAASDPMVRAHLEVPCETCETIVRAHLGLLQHRQAPELARRLDLEPETLKDHIDVLRRLDPKPGSRLNPAPSQYVIPDVTVVKVEDDYLAMLNEDGMPQLRISPVYRRMMNKGSQSSAETRAYVKEKLRSALWLIKSVNQRQKTIHKVATSIIRFQRAFLDHGIEHLRPLVLRDVANDINMHESTVSRVVNNKYMHTPQGVVEMKYFFHSGIHSLYGEHVSSVTIKQRIRKLIDQEDARKPLSDARIVRLLEDGGLVLARRTIAKYREELRIPTSSRRRVRD